MATKLIRRSTQAAGDVPAIPEATSEAPQPPVVEPATPSAPAVEATQAATPAKKEKLVVEIPAELHLKLRVFAAKAKKTLTASVTEILNEKLRDT